VELEGAAVVVVVVVVVVAAAGGAGGRGSEECSAASFGAVLCIKNKLCHKNAKFFEVLIWSKYSDNQCWLSYFSVKHLGVRVPRA